MAKNKDRSEASQPKDKNNTVSGNAQSGEEQDPGTSVSQTSKPSSKELSPPFDIEVFDPKTKKTNDLSVHFVLDESGNPIPIGDGSFGMIFKGYCPTAPLPECAIKLLYDNASINPRSLDGLQPEYVESASRAVAKWVIDSARSKDPAIDNPEYLQELLEQKLKDAINTNKTVPDNLAIDVASVLNHDDFAKLRIEVKDAMAQLRSAINSNAADRFRRERDVTRELRSQRGNQLAGVVDVRGGTSKFTDYVKPQAKKTDKQEESGWEPVRKFLQDTVQITWSGFALVMDLYSYSLKDLLEKTETQLNEKLDVSSHVQRSLEHKKLRGYDVLGTMTFGQRMREATLLLDEAVEGLSYLHNPVGDGTKQPFLHLDIKSGNIFIRRDGATGFKTVLGDLGNLPPKPQDQTISPFSGLPKSTLLEAPGTPNFRSPEQKYHVEVAYAEVTADNQRQVTLKVQDPKFTESLLVKGDVVVFSKDRLRKPRLIQEITPSPNDKPTEWVYTLTSAANETGQTKTVAQSADAPKDEATPPRLVSTQSIQVEFHKQQRHRTDLFGIGAVVYDIITCGQSPERFYESIRKFETRTVEDISSRYDNLRRGLSALDNPDLLEVFSPFRNDATLEYADKEIVEFILKCMLYKAPGTFFTDRLKLRDYKLGGVEQSDKAQGEPADGDEASGEAQDSDAQDGDRTAATATPDQAGQANNPAEAPSASKSDVEEVRVGPNSDGMLGRSSDPATQDESNDPNVEPGNAVKLLLKEFRALRRKYAVINNELPALIFGKYDDAEPQPAFGFAHEVDLLQRIPVHIDARVRRIPSYVAELQNVVDDPLLHEANRLVTGAFDFFLLCNHVRSFIGPRRLMKGGTVTYQRTFFHQMQPQAIFIIEGGNVSLRSDEGVNYAGEEDYLSDLQNNGLSRLVRQASNAFVPAALAGMRREVQLIPVPVAKARDPKPASSDAARAQADKQERFRIHTMDGTSFNVTIQDKDYLVLKRDVWQVNKANEDWTLTPVLKSHKPGEDEMPWPSGEATLFSKLDPFRYYLDMLGLYLQNLIFAHSIFTTTTRDRINFSALLQALNVPPHFNIAFNHAIDHPVTHLHDVYRKYVYLLLRLRCHDAMNSFYSVAGKDHEHYNEFHPDKPTPQEEAQSESLKQLMQGAKSVYRDVFAYLGVEAPQTDFDRPRIITDVEELNEECHKELEEQLKDKDSRFDIVRSVKDEEMLWVAPDTPEDANDSH
jgi:serine/threonine protein kinase